MLTINKITSASPVDYAAEELKKYLRMMMPECGDIRIAYNPLAADGFRLGLMQDFGLDVSDALDTELDDILYIDTDCEGGIIAGDNPRSVLLAVYEYLRQNGCRWLFPGVDGEFIPMQDIAPVKYRFKPSCRYRGQCNEGAEFQQSMMESIEFTPKIGMNVFMIEFRVPTPYYAAYYGHRMNDDNRPPEPLSDRQVLQWKRQCEAEIAKRGLQFHDIGHGFTIDPFGIDSARAWSQVDESTVPEDAREFIAMMNGERKLFHGQPINTNFCMSNPKARKRVADYVAGYAEGHSNIDYLHVWLADANNNHCECDECRKKIPSDWYMMLMNDIDDALTEKKLDTRIVFIVYNDTTWPPTVDRIKNPKRFAILLAPISRSYLMTLPESGVTSKPKPFVLNNLIRPASLEEYLAYFAEWRRFWSGGAFAYEYHFWWHMACDLGGIALAERINEDVKAYKANEVNGVVEDGSQRAFFPNGLAFYTYARTLFDTSLSAEEIAEDYYSFAYGEDWKKFYDYLKKVGELFDVRYFEGALSKDPSISRYYNPEYAKSLDALEGILAEGEELIKSHYNSDYRVRTASVRLLEKHQEFCRLLADTFKLKAVGNDAEAKLAFERFRSTFGKYETEIERCFDHHIYLSKYYRDACVDISKLPNAVTEL